MKEIEHIGTVAVTEGPLPQEHQLSVTGFRGNPLRVVLSNGHEATITQKLIDAFATPSPFDHLQGINPDQEQEIADRIRSAYDRGYNDARNASSVPGDNAASYRGRDMSNEITAELLAGLRRLSKTYQQRVSHAHHALFHDDPTDVAERVARFFEEAVETCQALGMTHYDADKLLSYTYDRPVGDPAKEMGSAYLTLASLCVIAGYDLAACGEADLEKLQRPETIARIRAKRATRHGRGPLPGFDPAVASEGSTDGN